MPPSVGKEIKQTFGDHLRGVRYLVRMLGSDEQRPGFAPPVLPEALPELDRLMGKTLRAIDSVMCVVETAVVSIRSSPSGFTGFSPLEAYKAAQNGDYLQEDLYVGLKAVAAKEKPNQLILKSRLIGAQDEFVTSIASTNTPHEISAGILLFLVQRNPVVDLREACPDTYILKQYVALALLFGLSVSRPFQQSEATSLIEDALLLAGSRIDLLSKKIKNGENKAGLVTSLASLLDHLG